MVGSLFRTKSINWRFADSADSVDTGDNATKRALGAWALLALSVGAIVGAGLFVLNGGAS